MSFGASASCERCGGPLLPTDLGELCARCLFATLLVACREIARLTRRFSRASLSIPLTRPTVDTVIRRGEKPNAWASVRMRSDFTVAA